MFHSSFRFSLSFPAHPRFPHFRACLRFLSDILFPLSLLSPPCPLFLPVFALGHPELLSVPLLGGGGRGPSLERSDTPVDTCEPAPCRQPRDATHPLLWVWPAVHSPRCAQSPRSPLRWRLVYARLLPSRLKTELTLNLQTLSRLVSDSLQFKGEINIKRKAPGGGWPGCRPTQRGWGAGIEGRRRTARRPRGRGRASCSAANAHGPGRGHQ